MTNTGGVAGGASGTGGTLPPLPRANCGPSTAPTVPTIRVVKMSSAIRGVRARRKRRVASQVMGDPPLLWLLACLVRWGTMVSGGKCSGQRAGDCRQEFVKSSRRFLHNFYGSRVFLLPRLSLAYQTLRLSRKAPSQCDALQLLCPSGGGPAIHAPSNTGL